MKAVYSIGTWDMEEQAYTPQLGLTVPCINVTWPVLMQVMRELRLLGYKAHRIRDPEGTHDDNDWSVLVDRTDGMSEQEILDSWKR